MERSRVLGVVAALTLTLAVTTPAAAGRPTGADDALVVGSLAPETGPLAPVLDSLRTPVRMAVDEIDAAGGVGGRPVTLLTADEGTDAASARRGLATLLEGGAQAVIGPASSSAALAVVGQLRGRALACAGSNGAEALSTLGPRRSDGRYFRTSPPDRYQGLALAELIVGDGHRRVAVIARDDATGDVLTEPLVAALRDAGAKAPVVARYDPSQQDVGATVQRALAAHPDAVAVVGELEDGARVLAALRDAGAGPMQLPTYGTDALFSGSLADLVDPVDAGALWGFRGVAPAVAPAGIEHPFLDAYAATGLDPVFSAHLYDCTILTALAAERAGSVDPQKMAQAFAANLHGRHDCETFAACRDLLAAGKTIHYRGASSRFDRFGRFQPREGVYQPWSYDADGTPRDDDRSTQLTVP